MATYQKTIIIESNKRSADQDFGEANTNTGLYQPGDLGNTSNNRWQTHIPNGLPLEIGDTINLESSMINAVGGGDSVIELTGFTGKEKQGERVRDNIGSIGFGFYVTNTQQFNFNLPKQRFQTSYRLNDARYGSYENMYSALGAAPPAAAVKNNADFYTWEKSYPYQCVEGCLVNLKINNALSIGYEYETLPIPEANVNYNLYLPSLSTGSRRTFQPNEKRFYIGSRKFTGPHYIAKENVPVPDEAVPPTTYNYVLDTPWDYLTQTVEFKVDEGFITPSSLAAQLTEQLHTREGNADAFNSVNVVPVSFKIGDKSAGGGGDGVQPKELLGVTDQVNITLPQCVGKPWYANMLDANSENPYPYDTGIPDARTGGWDAQPYKYAGGAQDFSVIGQGYVANQGDAIYYSYMMTARPDYYKAVTNLLVNMETRPQSDTGAIDQTRQYTLYTGFREINIGGVASPSITVRQKFPLSNPPAATDHEYITGAMGLGIMLLDQLPARNDQLLITTNNQGGIAGNTGNQTKEINVWNPVAGDYVVTNMIVNSSVKQILENTFRDYFMVYNKDVGTVNPTDTQFQQGLAMELNFGRIDDMQTEQFDPENPTDVGGFNVGTYSGKEVNIPCPYWTFFKTQLPRVLPGDSVNQSSYYWSGFQYEHKVDAQVTQPKPAQPVYADTDYNTATNPSLSGTDRCDEGRWYAEYYLDPTYTAEQAYNGQIPAPTSATNFQVEPNPELKALYSFERYKTEIWDAIPTDRNGLKLAFLPVCWKTNAGNSGAHYWFGTSGYFNFYYAWIYKARIPPDFQFGIPVTDPEYNIGFPQPLPLPGEYVGLSPSETTCDLAQLVSTQKQGYGEAPYPPQPLANNLPSTTGAQLVTPQTYIPYVFVGATDPLFRFDDGQGKFSITQLHTPLKSGNGTFQIPSIPQSTEPNIIQASSHFKRAMITKNIRNGFFKLNDANIQHIFFNDLVSLPGSIINAQSGVAILGLSLVGENFTTIPIAPEFNQEFYRDCIFNKMGFTLEQLVPVFGTAQAQFNRANYNGYLGFSDGIDIYKKFNNMVKPFTTNAYISSTLMLAFSRIISFTDIPIKQGNPATFPDPYEAGKKYFSPVPAFNLGVLPPNTEANVQAESDSLIAAGLPKKLSYPYLVVRTNLVLSPDYIGGESGYEKLPAIAYITRNYSEGDYFYSFTTNWNFTVDMPYVVSNIITDIRLPNGRPAPIDNNSSVIYKINKLRKLPDMAGIEEAEAKEEAEMQKANPKVAPQS